MSAAPPDVINEQTIRLRRERNDARSQLATLTAERDAYKAELERLAATVCPTCRRDADAKAVLARKAPNPPGGRDVSGRAFLCQHANEAPMVCPCKRGCYCKKRTCAGVETMAHARERLRRERAELRRWLRRIKGTPKGRRK